MLPILFWILCTIVVFAMIKSLFASFYDIYSNKNISRILDGLLFVTVIIFQSILYNQQYKNIKDTSIFNLYIALPIVFIVLPIFAIITFFPELNIIGPFSNTFGYLLIVMGGVKNIYLSLLDNKGDNEKLITALTRNVSLVVNDMQVGDKFWENIANLINKKIFKNPSDNTLTSNRTRMQEKGSSTVIDPAAAVSSVLEAATPFTRGGGKETKTLSYNSSCVEGKACNAYKSLYRLLCLLKKKVFIFLIISFFDAFCFFYI